MKDDQGQNTTDVKLAKTLIYDITVRKMIEGVSTNSITFAKLTASSLATAKIELPTDVQTSGTPIKGSYKIKCVDKNGQVSMTNDITYNHGT